MVTAKAAPRRWTLLCSLLCFVCCGLGLLGLALPVLAAGSEGEPKPYDPTWEGVSEPAVPAETSCPSGPPEISEAEAEELESAERLSRAERLEQAQACDRFEELQVELAHRAWWLASELGQLRALVRQISDGVSEGGRTDQQLEAIKKSLADPQGQKVQLLGYPKPLEVQSGAGGLALDDDQLEVSDEAVLAAVREGTETDNQNWWGIAGLAAGVLALLWAWRMVRP